MLVVFALDNAKVVPFGLDDAKEPNANDFAVQWNIGFTFFPFFQLFYAGIGIVLVMVLMFDICYTEWCGRTNCMFEICSV